MVVTSNEEFPRDITVEVLSGLPVKSLMRFRCVCKSWYDLFKSPSFISKHLKNDNDTRLFVVYMFMDETEEFSYPVDLYCLFPDETLADISLQNFHLQDPGCEIVGGPYDGIFCICGINNHLTLWNRATKETRALPKFRDIPHYTSKCSTNFGFGLDTMNNDYKFVMIVTLWDKKTNYLYEFSHVAVYNLSTNSWRDSQHFKTIDYYMDYFSDCTYLDGVCYWLFSFRNDFGQKVICSFQMDEEVVEVIPGPCFHESEHGTLGLYNCSLSLIVFDKNVNCFDIWMMMREKCWTKILTVGPLLGVQMPLGFWKKGAFFLNSNTRELLLYDPIAQELRYLGLKSSWFIVHTYKESLITIKEDDFEIPWHILGVY